MGRFLAVLPVFILFGVSVLMGQPTEMEFKYISLNEGLSNAYVHAIAQDDDGYIWIGTDDGLNRFNGYEMTVYRHDKADSFSIAGNSVTTLLKDGKGRLWVGSDEGLDLYNPDMDHFIHIQNSGSLVSALFESSDSAIWIGTSQGIARYNEESKTVEKVYFYEESSSLRFDDSGFPVNVFKEYDGRFMIVGTWQGVLAIDKRQKTVRKISVAELASGDDHISSLEIDGNKNIWIGTYGGGVFQMDFSRNRLRKVNISGGNRIDEKVLSLFLDGEGHLWVGTEQCGLYKLYMNSFDESGFEYEHFIDNELPGSLSYRSVTCMFKDADAGLWIGAHNGGVNYLSAGRRYFGSIRRNPFMNSTISHKKVWGVCEDLQGNIWIGTDGGGLDRYNPHTGAITNYRADGGHGSLADNAILCAYRDNDGDLWFGTYAGGLNRYIPSSQKFKTHKHLPGDTASIGGNDVRAIIQDRERRLWVATNQGGLNVLNKTTGQFKRYNTANSALATNDIRSLYIDKKQRLWIGTFEQGLYLFDSGRFQNYRLENGANRDNIIFSIDEDANGNLWLGSYGAGLLKFDPESRQFEIFDEKRGLANNVVHAVAVDRDNYVWTASNQGISRFNIEKQEFVNYNTNDGLPTLAFNDGSVLKSQNGSFYFGSLDGLVFFDPREEYRQIKPSKVNIEELRIFNKVVKPGHVEGLLKKGFNNTSHLTFNSSQSVFSLQYAAIHYPNPDKLHYSYMLEGIDEQWNYVNKLRNVTYTTLPSGDYVFKVRASLDNKNWSDETYLFITALPPFWKSSWAYGLYALVAGLIILISRRYKLNKLKMKRMIELEQIEKKRLAEIYTLKMNFFTNISHEFRTPLTLILSPLEQIVKDQDLHEIVRNKLLSVYNHANKLLRLINQLMEFRKVETGNMNLKVTENELVNFTYEVYRAFIELADLNSIEFKFNSNADSLNLWFNQKHFETILYNLISNAFKYTPNHGKVSVEIDARRQEGICYISVRDNGKGISEEYINQIFNKYYQVVEAETIHIMGTGIGLALVKDLVELHKGKIEVKSQKNSGTEISLKFRLGSDHFLDNQLIRDNVGEWQNGHDRLPIVDMPVVKEEARPVSQKHSILIVEDNADIRSYIQSLFAGYYKVFEAEEGEEGFQIAKAKNPSVVVSDIMMPGMDGIELCKKLKQDKQTLHIPVVLLTAKADDLHKLEGISIGADDYVTKPFNADIFKAKINTLIRNQSRLREYYASRILLQPVEESLNSADKEFLDKAIETVEKNLLDSDFGIKQLMDELCVSQPTLYRKIKQLTGGSTTEFIRSVRIKRAAELISQNQYAISQIAYDVGFSSVRYFRDSFVKLYKKTPSEYARESRNRKTNDKEQSQIV